MKVYTFKDVFFQLKIEIVLIPSSFTKQLTADPIKENHTRQVMAAHYSLVNPVSFDNATLIHVTNDVSHTLDFSEEYINSKEFLNLVTGSDNYQNLSFAMNYGGHQFGNWAGQLGDGRAINIGQIDAHHQSWQLQLKGSGPTPYSRRGDGYAVLRSSIREHLCSEAMHHLGIPTTRSLSLALTGEQVYRDMFYDGNAAYEKGAVVCRVAPTFIRFGNFQIHAVNGRVDLLKDLADYTIATYYPEIAVDDPNKYVTFFKQVAGATLEMIMHWQRVGFVHGVMNTDNMSILGLTIDYGPYGWLDDYDLKWTPNTTDNQHKRYRYGAQPEIGLWNLWQLANALFPLTENSEGLEATLDQYRKDYELQHLNMMRAKLGLMQPKEADTELIRTLLQLLPAHETDMTIFYRELIKIDSSQSVEEAWTILEVAFYDLHVMPASIKEQWVSWLLVYIKRHDGESAFAKARTLKMQQSNPKYVLRNYMAQLVIEQAEKGSYELFAEVATMLENPYQDQPLMDRWYSKRPDWARNKPGSSQLSCSS